ncbi:hypothetical protein V6N11_082725 [Hibiscus sabdariffa]|uniref:Uncharacterized protein n=1 Tax=Hibiscus sabdariffa TaxID=183260 RepID=A0ABR2QJY5_9ROSI
MDASSGNDDNGSNGPDASANNGPDSVHFGWNNEMVDEESYEAQEGSGESDWLGREHLLSDDDDEELNAIGTQNDIQDTNEEAENEANRADENAVNENKADGIGDNEADVANESEIEGNEASSVGLSTGEETDYLGSSDVGSYEIDSDGDYVSRKNTKVQNHADQPPPMPTSTGPSSPSYSIGPSAPQPSNTPSNTPSSPPHSTGPAAPPMVFMPTPSVQPSFAFDSTSPPAQPLVTKKTVFSPKRKVTANQIPMYRKSREHVTPSKTDMPHVSS